MEKIAFKNYPDTSTPIDANNLNLMQDNIEKAIDDVGIIATNSNGSYIKLESGALIQWGVNTGVDNSYREITFPYQFSSQPRAVLANTNIFDASYVHFVQISNITQNNFRAYVRYSNSNTNNWGIGSNGFY